MARYGSGDRYDGDDRYDDDGRYGGDARYDDRYEDRFRDLRGDGSHPAYGAYGEYGYPESGDYLDSADRSERRRPGDRSRKRSRRGRPRRRKRGLILLAVILALLGSGVVAGGLYYSSIKLPDELKLPDASTVYYSDGTTVMARLGVRNQVLVDPATLPAYVRSSVVAAEDTGFWDGTLTKLSRTVIRLISEVDGDSIPDKGRVAILTWKLEDKWSKEKILDFYLNTAPFGRGAYGIEAASKAFVGKSAKDLELAEAMVLAGMLKQPDGIFDPTQNRTNAEARLRVVRDSMVAMGALDQPTAATVGLPTSFVKFDPASLATELDRPTGLVTSHVLAEMTAAPAFKGKSWADLRDGGYRIVTTLDQRAQALLEKTADETVTGSVMNGQPENLQAAAVVVEPGTGRVLAYFGGHSGTGADFAGWYFDEAGDASGFGAHPAGGTFQAYVLAAALKNGVSVRSMWNARSPMEFPEADRVTGKLGPVRNTGSCPTRASTCSLADSTTASLNTPFYALTLRIGAAEVIDMAKAAGIDFMWAITGADAGNRLRVDLRSTEGKDLVPSRFSPEVAVGQFPVTVIDQASAMATFAAKGRRAPTHFVKEVSLGGTVVYSERVDADGATLPLSADQLADLTWAMSRTTAGKVTGIASATKTGTWHVGDTPTDYAHAWMVGFTPHLGMAVWVGNRGEEKVIADKAGKAVTGATLPAAIYRAFVTGAYPALKLDKAAKFPAPKYTGDATLGNAGTSG
jgi:membrane peptidoglycan carboxypeptidase